MEFRHHDHASSNTQDSMEFVKLFLTDENVGWDILMEPSSASSSMREITQTPEAGGARNKYNRLIR